jgi:hypothetical protein
MAFSTSAWPSAAASAAACVESRGNDIVARSLPFTCTAMVTVSSATSAGSAFGQGRWQIRSSWPNNCQISSARWGVIGAISRASVS